VGTIRSNKVRTRVAYVLTPVDFGGAEKVSLTFLETVDRSLFDIHVITLIRPWEKDNSFTNAILKTGYRAHGVPVASKPASEGKDYLRVLRCCKLMYAILKEGAFDLVHTHGYFADIVTTLSVKLLKVPHVSTCHGFISTNRSLSLYNKMDHWVLRFADRIIAVSNEMKSDLVGSGIKTSKITVITNAVTMISQQGFEQARRDGRSVLGIGADEFVVGYVGRLSKEKGLQYLLEATAILRTDGIKIRTLLIGEGPERSVLENFVGSIGIANNVIFLGFNHQPEKWLPTMDAFVLPSLTEGTPMALLEAMSCGLPVIASAVGGIPDVVEPMRNGILISAGHASEIAESLLCLQKDVALRCKLGAEAKQTVEKKYNSRDWAKRIESEYLNLTR
jgi:glycosyltransferase involved in cell wall biosynthesis